MNQLKCNFLENQERGYFGVQALHDLLGFCVQPLDNRAGWHTQVSSPTQSSQLRHPSDQLHVIVEKGTILTAGRVIAHCEGY